MVNVPYNKSINYLYKEVERLFAFVSFFRFSFSFYFNLFIFCLPIMVIKTARLVIILLSLNFKSVQFCTNVYDGVSVHYPSTIHIDDPYT
jgi:hypothetical protein